MIDWVWVRSDVANALHDRQLAEHGGPSGVRDANAFTSALARPRNLAAYGDPDPASLAAAYAYGIARNNPFVDGNKRTAWATARLFLAINNIDLAFDKAHATQMALSLAAGELTEDEVADWFRDHIVTG